MIINGTVKLFQKAEPSNNSHKKKNKLKTNSSIMPFKILIFIHW